MRLIAALPLALLSATALGSIGKVTALEGTANRTPSGGTQAPLAEGTELEVGDVIDVGTPGNLKLELTDESELMLGPGSKLTINEADFGSLDDRRFSAQLGIGALWAHVKRALVGSTAKFEVTTDRAVAGVRGTIFEVEVAPGAEKETDVGVEEGEVEVLQPDEDAPASAPIEKRWKHHRIKKGETLVLKHRFAQKRKMIRRADAFHRFVLKHRIARQMNKIERQHRRR